MRSSVQTLIEDFIRNIETATANQIVAALEAAFSSSSSPAQRGRAHPSLKGGTAPSATRRLQGRYLGLLRGLKGAERARVQATARQDGVAEAIALAERLKVL